MKAKILASFLRKIEDAWLRSETLPRKSENDPFENRCVALALFAVLSEKKGWYKIPQKACEDHPDWISTHFSEEEKEWLDSATDLAPNSGIFEFDNFDLLHHKVVYRWEKPNESDSESDSERTDKRESSSFNEIFKKPKPDGGYLICIKFEQDDCPGHVMAVKFREGKWRFMDPVISEDETGERYYFHAVPTEEGKIAIPLNQRLEVLDLIKDYIFRAYDQPEEQKMISRMGIVRIRYKREN